MDQYVSYERVSPKPSTAKKGTEIGQEIIIKDYCRRNKFQLVKRFVDLEESGKDLNRQGLQEMLKYLEKNDKIKGVIVTDQDRLSRDLRGTLELYDFLREHNKALKIILDPIDIQTEEGELFGQIKAVFASYERTQIKKRQKQAIKRFIEEKGYWGRKPPKINEKQFIHYFQFFNGNMTSTSKLLGVSRSYLYKWVDLEHIDLMKMRELYRNGIEIKEIPRIEGE